jgi:nucleoside-diphosphate-sugar epimerase
MKNILVTGALGQVGSDLVPALERKSGVNIVVAIDIRPARAGSSGTNLLIDTSDILAIEEVIEKYNIDTIFHMVGILSARGEQEPALAWHVNMEGLKNVLDLSVKHNLRVFWPSSMAAFGPTTPRIDTPQKTILEPTTMYGITKVAGELLCQYYYYKHNLDVRSLRYPGLISWKAEPGGGTTDYAVAMFSEALDNGKYECFVKPDTILPMMYIDDAIKGTIQLMEAPKDDIKIRTSYNMTAFSFKAEELAAEISKHIKIDVTYAPDNRQDIAESWPRSIDDSQARQDWGWKPSFDLVTMTEEMIKQMKGSLQKNV